MHVVQASEMGRMEGWEGMSMQLWSLANSSKVELVPTILSVSIKREMYPKVIDSRYKCLVQSCCLCSFK